MDVIERRRILLQSQDLPPLGYRWIEYAEETRAYAYVTLPFGFDATDKLEIKGALDTTQSGEHWLVGPTTWNQGGNRRLGFFGSSNASFAFAYGAQGTPNNLLIPTPSVDGNVHIATYNNYTFRLYDGGLDSVMDVSNIIFGGSTDSLRLFYGYAKCKGKIYYFKQQKANGEELYIRPIQHKTTDEVEMYDTISKTIMQRTGTLYPPT